MKRIFAKISLIIVFIIVFYACDSTRRVPNGKSLLTKTELKVDEKVINDENLTNLLIQKPNPKVLTIPFSLHIYNLGRPNPDSVFASKFIHDTLKFKRTAKLLSKKQVYRLGESFWHKGIHTFLKSTGDEPVIYDEIKTKKTINRLKSHYFNEGYFNVKATYTTDSVGPKKLKSTFLIQLGEPYKIDSITTAIASPALDSLYMLTKSSSLIKKGNNYNSSVFDEERSRLTAYFRNNGVYNFQQNFITYDIDTIDTGKKANVKILINDFTYRDGDTIRTKPFQIHRISEVNIYTINPNQRNNSSITDSLTYNNYNLYSSGKFKYKPKSITNAVFISKGGTYADYKNNLTTRSLSNYKVFTYPSIQYKINEKDSIHNSLVATIFLNPRPKYSFGASFDVTHSNIQDFGIAGHLTFSIRNLFNRAETLEISGRGNIGSSRDLANPDNRFFNISEFGGDVRINFPRFLFPFASDKIIPKSMFPSTQLSVGFAKQQNIGLDKENLTGAFTYNWIPKRNNTVKFDLFNIQYVKNINIGNYFNVYRSSYSALNSISRDYAVNSNYYNENQNLIINSGTDGFLNDVLGDNPTIFPTISDLREIRSIQERKERLTENNLILASSYSFTKTTKTNILDYNFYLFRIKIESAGNLLSLLARASNQPLNESQNRTIFDIEFSQYLKTEFEYIKHFELKRQNVIATRVFLGVAVPYGNSNNIPFSRSYFAGGINDNRAWRPYSLGPGRSGSQNDFNDANLKISLNAEYRFNVTQKIKGALFVDAGNIWNFLDNIKNEDAKFKDLSSLKDIAVGSGFGIRYDFGFVVARFDVGFKTFNPAVNSEQRWFRDYNFSNSVFNFGINYPF